MLKVVGPVLFCLAGLCGVMIPADAAVMDAVNGDKAPKSLSWWSPTKEVGWTYTPGFAYDLTSIETQFGRPEAPTPSGTPWPPRTVTVEVYDAHPMEGGHLLRSAGFLAAPSLAGGVFPSLRLVAGEDYFIGFRNVNGLGVNITNDRWATSLSPLRYEYEYVSGTGPGPYVYSTTLGSVDKPILRFLGEEIVSAAATPEPASLALLGIGALPLLGRLRRREPRDER